MANFDEALNQAISNVDATAAAERKSLIASLDYFQKLYGKGKTVLLDRLRNPDVSIFDFMEYELDLIFLLLTSGVYESLESSQRTIGSEFVTVGDEESFSNIVKPIDGPSPDQMSMTELAEYISQLQNLKTSLSKQPKIQETISRVIESVGYLEKAQKAEVNFQEITLQQMITKVREAKEKKMEYMKKLYEKDKDYVIFVESVNSLYDEVIRRLESFISLKDKKVMLSEKEINSAVARINQIIYYWEVPFILDEEDFVREPLNLEKNISDIDQAVDGIADLFDVQENE